MPGATNPPIERNLFAYTAPGPDMPAFISVDRRDGGVEVEVRSDRTRRSSQAVIRLTEGQARDLARAIIMKLPCRRDPAH
jgi:hypothetical protein